MLTLRFIAKEKVFAILVPTICKGSVNTHFKIKLDFFRKLLLLQTVCWCCRYLLFVEKDKRWMVIFLFEKFLSYEFLSIFLDSERCFILNYEL